MERHDFTEANRRAWNEAAKRHQAYRGAQLLSDFSRPGHSTLDAVFAEAIRAANLTGARIAHLCCNNGIELISALNLGAASGVGFDISDEAIDEARRLAQAAHAPATFVRTDVYDIDAAYDGAFDQLWFTIGGLTWLPDLPAIFARAARLLAPGGTLLIYDLHPFTTLLAVPKEPAFREPYRVEYGYFRSEPIVDTSGIDYLGHTTYAAPPSYDFSPTLGEILTAVAQAGFVLRAFREYPHDIANLFGHVAADGKLPLCFLLEATRP